MFVRVKMGDFLQTLPNFHIDLRTDYISEVKGQGQISQIYMKDFFPKIWHKRAFGLKGELFKFWRSKVTVTLFIVRSQYHWIIPKSAAVVVISLSRFLTIHR